MDNDVLQAARILLRELRGSTRDARSQRRPRDPHDYDHHAPREVLGVTSTETDNLLTLRPVGRCRQCRTVLLPKDVWTSIPKAVRRDLVVVFSRHQGRRLCSACWERVANAGELVDHEAGHVPQSGAPRTTRQSATIYPVMEARTPVSGPLVTGGASTPTR